MTLEDLHKQILACRLCRDKFGFEPKPYVWGNENAKIVQISQAPSLSVYKSGIPFNDKSGERLLRWYDIDREVFYDKKLFYITSFAHCYPGKTPAGNDRRPPSVCARRWLERELEFLTPLLYIIIGSYAAKYFFGNEKFENLIFDNNLTIRNIPVFVLPHPSPLNWRWLARHPRFEKEVLPKLRLALKKLIFNKN